MLTKDIQEDFIKNNFNKPVVFFNKIGRLIGYVETKTNFYNVIFFSREEPVYLEAGLKIFVVEKDNVLYDEINSTLLRNFNPELENYFYQDLKDDILFNSYGLEYLKHKVLSIHNNIVLIDNNIVRLVGYCSDDFGNSYIAKDINNNTVYFDSLCSVKEAKFNATVLSHFENNIEKADCLIFEDLTKPEEE